MDESRLRSILVAHGFGLADLDDAPRDPRAALDRPLDGARSIELSPRALEVLELVADGYTNRDIGRALHIGVETVKSHVAGTCRVIGARNRAHAVAIALRSGLLPRASAN